MRFFVNDGQQAGLGWNAHDLVPTEFPEFGVTITSEQKEHTAIGPAVIGIATVPSKTLSGLEDAARRINELLGLIVLMNFGNCTLRWWCFLLHFGGGGSTPAVVKREHFEGFATGYRSLPESVQRYVRQALYWIRIARDTNPVGHRMDVLQSFEAYWNAVECATAAVMELKPISRSAEERIAAASQILSQICKNDAVTLKDIDRLIRAARPLGEKDRLHHAIVTLFRPSIEDETEISNFVKELYDARNRAKHGKVDVERDDVLRRFEKTLQPLKYLSLDLLYILLGRRGFGGWTWVQGVRSRS